MNDIYNYKNNINVTQTPNGDVVITMNREIYKELMNHIFDASMYQKSKNHNATAESTMEMWGAMNYDGQQCAISNEMGDK